MENLNFFKAKSSLSEWLTESKSKFTDIFIEEDSSKSNRLSLMNDLFGLPIVTKNVFLLEDIKKHSQKYLDFKKKAASMPYAIRANPLENNLPILRNRNLNVQDLEDWILNQLFDFEKYSIEFSPHVAGTWSMIFVVNANGIFGEIIDGGLAQLTQGFLEKESNESIDFSYNYSSWEFSSQSIAKQQVCQMVINHINIIDVDVQKKIEKALRKTFTNRYLHGYYEVVIESDLFVYYIDYNRILDQILFEKSNFTDLDENDIQSEEILRGRIGSQGTAIGKVVIIDDTNYKSVPFVEGDVLVATNTSTSYMSLIKKASAIITDMGGILSHAAIVCRELKKPCIVGTVEATKLLKNGDMVLVDATKGIVFKKT